MSRISKLVGEESSFDLKPFVLVNRQWHAVASPTLLAAISITSLGKLVELCDQIIAYQHDGDVPRSTVAKYTKIIAISGITDGDVDSHLGLDDLGEQLRGDPQEHFIQPDIEIGPDAMRDKLRIALSQLVLLNGFEWYGRFAGDYYLARYLQQSKVIRHLAYGIEMFAYCISQVYCDHAFAFEGLETLTITSEYEPRRELFRAIAKMLHTSPDLRSILFDCKYAESMSGYWSLIDLICDTSLPDKPMGTWPNLNRLVLRFWIGGFWRSAEELELISKFLVAHPKLETLVFQESSLEDPGDETAKPLSLTEYPDSLPGLKRLIGSPRLIAGVLESRAACLSVERVIDNSEGSFDSEGVKAPYVERIMDAIENAPNNRIQRLRLEIPQLNRKLYTRIAQLAPNIYFLEFLRSFEFDSTTPNDGDFNPLVDIPSGLNEFPNLEIIGGHIAKDFAKALGSQEHDGILELARQVPRIKAVHELQGKLIPIYHHSNGKVSIAEHPQFLENGDYDWITFDVDWRHRPMSHHALQRMRDARNAFGCGI